MEAKFMKGPWEVAGGEIWASGERIAPGKGAYEERDASVNKANAHLMAAAPDLYEALAECELLLSVTKHLSWQGEQAKQNARAALAKARGETNPGKAA
jgi:hypothetical protein